MEFIEAYKINNRYKTIKVNSLFPEFWETVFVTDDGSIIVPFDFIIYPDKPAEAFVRTYLMTDENLERCNITIRDCASYVRFKKEYLGNKKMIHKCVELYRLGGEDIFVDLSEITEKPYGKEFVDYISDMLKNYPEEFKY